ncbi:hypothetical protein [Vibrio diabolicus]|uniref:hypothetical protein n=1 Tax=Vibrio diabolicus TaxID=50719 RepID=UPI00232F7E50|nr:hypothetical protein [Vibrio diabolicus]
MNIYRLKRPIDTYEVIDFDIFQFAENLGDEQLTLVRSQPRTNESLLGRWGDVVCSISKEYQGKTLPSISFWGSYLIFTQKAFIALSDRLSEYGEFLPINADGNELFIFNCLTFGQEDKELCEKIFEDGYEVGLKSLHFHSVDVADKLIFKSQLLGPQSLLAIEEFKRMYETCGLDGVIFDADLLNPFS